jgi:hypothetical protein
MHGADTAPTQTTPQVYANYTYAFNSSVATSDASGSLFLEGMADAVITVPAGCRDAGLSTAAANVVTRVPLRFVLPNRGLRGSIVLSPLISLAGF